MNLLEKNMINILLDMKKNYHVLSVKAEFEAEGTLLDEAIRLKEIVSSANLELTIKIGGCEAKKDMFEAKTIGANRLVAPMIETPYALKKYIQAILQIFTVDERKDIKFYINIETITGFNNFNDMLDMPEINHLSGIVLGRADMTGSIGLTKGAVNEDIILNIAKEISLKAKKNNLDFIIGGGVCPKSLSFFNALDEEMLDGYETRKIIFDAQALKADNAEEGILKALEFELMWLQNKRDFYGTILKEDEQRLEMLAKKGIYKV